MHIIQKSNILNIKKGKLPGSVMPVSGNSATLDVTKPLLWAVFPTPPPPTKTVKDVNVAKEQKQKANKKENAS